MPPGLFPSFRDISPAEKNAGNIKEFIGDGSPILRVPGLKKVASVRVGPMNIPLERDYKFPLNSDFTQKVHTTLPHVMQETLEDGTPILLRSTHSNDGLWQKGEKIYVGGEWEDDESEPEFKAAGALSSAANDAKPASQPNPEEEARKFLRGKTVAELKEQAAAANIAVPDSAVKEQIITLLIEAAKASHEE